MSASPQVAKVLELVERILNSEATGAISELHQVQGATMAEMEDGQPNVIKYPVCSLQEMQRRS